MIESIQLDLQMCGDFGLQPGRLRNLGAIVAIAGPNGAGKSRLLRLLKKQWWALSRMAERIVAAGGSSQTSRHRMTEDEHPERAEKTMEALLHYLVAGAGIAPNPSEPGEWLTEAYAGELEHFRGTICLRGGSEQVVRSGSWPKLSLIVNDPRGDAPRQDETGNIKNLQPRSSTVRLGRAAQDLYMSHHPLWKERHMAEIESSEAFFRTVSAMLGVKCGWTVFDAQNQEQILPSFDGRPVFDGQLSEGQRVVLRWCELIHAEVDDLLDAIILLDEPELHLHPELLLRTFDRLRSLHPAQIWVATHSLPLLAHIGIPHIHEMRDGKLTWAGNRIQQVQHGLIGPGGAEHLRAFLSDAATIAFLQFSAECLLLPHAVPLSDPNDPQAKQLVSHVHHLLQSSTDLVHVLEYAAGSGRLIEAIAATDPTHREHLRYHAFCDPEHTTPEERERCHAQLTRLHPDDLAPFFHPDIRAIQRSDATKMHAVLLCNVLHEIPPAEWPTLMAAIAKCLRPDGWLVILEDQRMSVGELPHDKGFLVLDEIELRTLFAVTDPEHEQLRFALIQGRLSMAQVSAALLARCGPPKVQEALELLRDRALGQIRTLRRTATDPTTEHRRGRAHAYYAMLHTNATLALEKGPWPAEDVQRRSQARGRGASQPGAHRLWSRVDGRSKSGSTAPPPTLTCPWQACC